MDNLTETKLTSEKIYSGCILDFYRDTVRLPNGGTAPRAKSGEIRQKGPAYGCKRGLCAVRDILNGAVEHGDLRDHIPQPVGAKHIVECIISGVKYAAFVRRTGTSNTNRAIFRPNTIFLPLPFYDDLCTIAHTVFKIADGFETICFRIIRNDTCIQQVHLFSMLL